MNCPKCNAQIPDGSPFCTACGAQTGDQGAATVAISLLDIEDPLLKAVREELANEYYVEKELGRGGMAIVYKAKEIGLERVVALKILPPEMAMMGGTADRFKREARLAAQMEHPNIVQIYRVGQSGNFHYMAMKFVEGRAVDSILHAQGALPIPVVVRILRDSASALAFAHDAGIIHRDIKGGNILIDRDGRVLVGDFGIARAAGEASLTASGMVVGTPSFMSPEQCGAGAVVPQSDQYSLGILGFQLITGQLPFEADSLVEVIQHHYMTPPPDMREVRKEVPQELYDVVYKALAKSPDDRFATTAEMAEALDAVPLTPEEKKDAVAMLKGLSAGEKLGEIRTGSLPPVKIRTGAMGKVGTGTAMAEMPKKSRAGLIAASLIGVVGVGGAGYYFGVMQPQAQRAAQAARDSATAAVPTDAPGMVAIVGLPANARVKIGDVVVKPTGGVVPPGTYTYTITAAGYRDTSGTVTVTPANTVTLAPTLEPSGPVAPRPRPAVEAAAPAVAAPTGISNLRVASDPVSADIYLDGNKIGAGRVQQDIPAGSHRLRIVLTGFQTFDTSFVAIANEPVNLGRKALKPAGGGP